MTTRTSKNQSNNSARLVFHTHRAVGATSVGGVDLLQVLEVVRAELVDDAGEQVLQLLGLMRARDNVGVGGDGRLH